MPKEKKIKKFSFTPSQTLWNVGLKTDHGLEGWCFNLERIISFLCLYISLSIFVSISIFLPFITDLLFFIFLNSIPHTCTVCIFLSLSFLLLYLSFAQSLSGVFKYSLKQKSLQNYFCNLLFTEAPKILHEACQFEIPC